MIDPYPEEKRDTTPERPPRPGCEFWNTETNVPCGNRAVYRCSLSGIVDRILVCAVHSKPFMGKVGATITQLDHLV